MNHSQHRLSWLGKIFVFFTKHNECLVFIQNYMCMCTYSIVWEWKLQILRWTMNFDPTIKNVLYLRALYYIHMALPTVRISYLSICTKKRNFWNQKEYFYFVKFIKVFSINFYKKLSKQILFSWGLSLEK